MLADVGTIGDPFLRALLLDTLWDEVRDARLAPLAYIDLALAQAPREPDELTVASLVARTQTALRWYLSDAQRAEAAPRVEAALVAGMTGAADKGQRITYFRAFVGAATTAEARATLKALLAGTREVPGVALSSRDRFRIVERLLALGDPDAEALLAAQSQADPSDNGRRYAYAAGAARPDPAAKRRQFAGWLRGPGAAGELDRREPRAVQHRRARALDRAVPRDRARAAAEAQARAEDLLRQQLARRVPRRARRSAGGRRGGEAVPARSEARPGPAPQGARAPRRARAHGEDPRRVRALRRRAPAKLPRQARSVPRGPRSMPPAPELAKLSRPRLYRVTRARAVVSRPRRAARAAPVVWVTGAPGTGKSALVASWLEARKLASVWYHIDPGDADPGTFFHYLGLAAPARGRNVPPLPRYAEEYRRDLPGFTRRWFREFFARLAPGSVLVFDDFHDARTGHAERAALAAGLEEIPAGITVVAISRGDPPARVRAPRRAPGDRAPGRRGAAVHARRGRRAAPCGGRSRPARHRPGVGARRRLGGRPDPAARARRRQGPRRRRSARPVRRTRSSTTSPARFSPAWRPTCAALRW